MILAGLPPTKRVVGDVPRDDRASRDERTVADRHTRQDDRPRTDPRAVSDPDRRLAHRSALDAVAVAVGDVDVVGDRDVVADGDLVAARQEDAVVEEDPVADPELAPAGDERALCVDQILKWSPTSMSVASTVGLPSIVACAPTDLQLRRYQLARARCLP